MLYRDRLRSMVRNWGLYRKVASIMGIISFFMPWRHISIWWLGARRIDHTRSLLFYFNVFKNTGLSFFRHPEMLAAVFILTGSVLVWFHRYGSIVQMGGCLYFKSVLPWAGWRFLGYGFELGLIASLIGLSALIMEVYPSFQHKIPEYIRPRLRTVAFILVIMATLFMAWLTFINQFPTRAPGQWWGYWLTHTRSCIFTVSEGF